MRPPAQTTHPQPRAPGLPGGGADSLERLAGRKSPTGSGPARGGLCGPQPRTPEWPRARSVPVESQGRNVPSTGSIWGGRHSGSTLPLAEQKCPSRATPATPHTVNPSGEEGRELPSNLRPRQGPAPASCEGEKNYR